MENEQAALVVPARFVGRIHPHFREVVQLLAVQMADEARHMEVFSRRALLRGTELGTSSAGGRQSLFTLVAESDFALASFLLSVLGEGSFVDLLVPAPERPGPGASGAAGPAAAGPTPAAIHRRHDALADTAGLNADVFDALVVLAAGGWHPTTCPPASNGCGPCNTRWTRGVSVGSSAWVSDPTRRRRSPRCTPATSCRRAVR
ncbi:hypothetical protein NKG94_14145 [Micromonospora sp. M12]